MSGKAGLELQGLVISIVPSVSCVGSMYVACALIVNQRALKQASG